MSSILITLLMYTQLAIALAALLLAMTPLAWILHQIWLYVKGAQYVPISDRDLDRLLADLHLRRGERFLDLGSGDGRVVCEAVRRYGVIGRGVEISWLLVIISRIRARVMGVEAEFVHGDIMDADIAWADVIYLYMLPKFLKKVAKKITDEKQPHAKVVSHRFEFKS